ncbi:DUF1016 N-terminal domain-containing protein [Streptomyces microflavus]
MSHLGVTRLESCVPQPRVNARSATGVRGYGLVAIRPNGVFETVRKRFLSPVWITYPGRSVTALRTEFPQQRGFSRSNLHYMQQMARTWPDSMVQQPVGPLPWGHIVLLMGKCPTRFELDSARMPGSRKGCGSCCPARRTSPASRTTS